MSAAMKSGRFVAGTDRGGRVRCKAPGSIVAGGGGVVSRRCAKASKRCLGESIKCRILARVRARYRDFGPTLALACLREEGFRGRDTLRLADRRLALARGQGASGTSVPGPAGPSGQGPCGRLTSATWQRPMPSCPRILLATTPASPSCPKTRLTLMLPVRER